MRQLEKSSQYSAVRDMDAAFSKSLIARTTLYSVTFFTSYQEAILKCPVAVGFEILLSSNYILLPRNSFLMAFLLLAFAAIYVALKAMLRF